MNKKILLFLVFLFIISETAFSLAEITTAAVQGPAQFSGEWFIGKPMDTQLRLLSHFINIAKENKVFIERDPEFYLKELYIQYNYDPRLLNYNVALMIKTIAMTYGDFRIQGKTEEEIFSGFYGEGWEKLYRDALGVRKNCAGNY